MLEFCSQIIFADLQVTKYSPIRSEDTNFIVFVIVNYIHDLYKT